MRRGTCVVAVLLTSVAFTAAGAPALGASAGKLVDNSTLNPPAPDFYTCYADGHNTICRGTQDLSGTNEDSGLTCGELPIYSTGTDIRQVTRYYDANGDLVWRRVQASANATWSLSPTGGGPAVTFVGHWGWTVRYAIPGDVDSGFLAAHGTDTLIKSPNGGVIVHEAGTNYAVGADFIDTGVYHGPHTWTTDPVGSLAKVCAALGA
jgi:hypothetical protein